MCEMMLAWTRVAVVEVMRSGQIQDRSGRLDHLELLMDLIWGKKRRQELTKTPDFCA